MQSLKDRPAVILLVEDDDQVRTFVRSVLTGAGYRTIEARTGLEGLALAEEHGSEIDLLLSDMLLPGLSGFDLAEQLRQRFPRLAILFMTGYVEGDRPKVYRRTPRRLPRQAFSAACSSRSDPRIASRTCPYLIDQSIPNGKTNQFACAV